MGSFSPSCHLDVISIYFCSRQLAPIPPSFSHTCKLSSHTRTYKHACTHTHKCSLFLPLRFSYRSTSKINFCEEKTFTKSIILRSFEPRKGFVFVRSPLVTETFVFQVLRSSDTRLARLDKSYLANQFDCHHHFMNATEMHLVPGNRKSKSGDNVHFFTETTFFFSVSKVHICLAYRIYHTGGAVVK